MVIDSEDESGNGRCGMRLWGWGYKMGIPGGGEGGRWWVRFGAWEIGLVSEI